MWAGLTLSKTETCGSPEAVYLTGAKGDYIPARDIGVWNKPPSNIVSRPVWRNDVDIGPAGI